MRRSLYPALLLAAALYLLSGCGSRPDAPSAAVSTPAPTAAAAPESTEAPAAGTAAPVSTETPAATEPPESAAAPEAEDAADTVPGPGSYIYAPEEGEPWVLNLKANGTFSLLHGPHIYNGEGWVVNDDGSVTTGPTEAAGEADFFDEFGSSTWRVNAESCTPVG